MENNMCRVCKYSVCVGVMTIVYNADFIVDKRDGEILLSIIKSEVDIGSKIY